MNILWITNIVFPEAEMQISGSADFKVSGGWLLGMCETLKLFPDIHLYTATVSNKVTSLIVVKGESGVVHYIFPKSAKNYTYEKGYEKYWKQIVKDSSPDIIHIHGTECPHGLSCIMMYPDKRYVVNIQGLISEIAKHYDDGITSWQILRNLTLRDFYKSNIWQEKAHFTKRGECEIKMLNSVEHVIGRTEWDHATALAINPRLHYHIGNESLRSAFYTGKWVYRDCVPHTIFLSQVGFPFKGFHLLIQALPLILREYPDFQVRISGPDIVRSKGNWKIKMRLNGYGNLLRKMIAKRKLEDHILFLGLLSAEEMKKELLRANVFVSCSSIDNSPNSLGEAQMLGVPCVASYVGGVPSMIPNEHCGLLYRYEDYQHLAYNINAIFSESASFDNTVMREIAHSRHDRENNANQLVKVYKEILKQT